MIPFNKPIFLRDFNIHDLEKLSGDGKATASVNNFLSRSLGYNNPLLTTSCSTALEMAAILLNISPGDEIICPSYTFVSTANAFVLRGARIVFVDIRPDTLNIDENLIEKAITEKTKAIVVVHYAGVPCEMDKIMKISSKYNIDVVEDAAQAIGSYYKGKLVGTFGVLSTLSFHETKNFTMGEGGALIVNKSELFERAKVIREKGTNREKFLLGLVDKYSWVDIGGSYLPSELNALYLLKQFEQYDLICEKRNSLWNRYFSNLTELSAFIDLPYIPSYSKHNSHLFYIKLKDFNQREKIRQYLIDSNITAIFHYIPLHSSEAGIKHSVFSGTDIYTTKESERVLRLPIYFDLKISEVDYICDSIKDFLYGNHE